MADDAAFFAPMDDTGDEPIVLGAPPAEPPAGDYIGEIDAAPPAQYMMHEEESMPFESTPFESMPAVMTAPPAEYLAPGVEEVEEEEEVVVAPEISNEPSPMTVWNNEWQVTLKQRRDEENAQKGAAVEQAEADLANVAAQREAKREARISKNRADEQDKLEAIEADLENDNSWQRVVKMVELNQDALEDSKDCSRMKDVLILLKNDADRAAILA
jgi:hypothetical protein